MAEPFGKQGSVVASGKDDDLFMIETRVTIATVRTIVIVAIKKPPVIA